MLIFFCFFSTIKIYSNVVIKKYVVIKIYQEKLKIFLITVKLINHVETDYKKSSSSLNVSYFCIFLYIFLIFLNFTKIYRMYLFSLHFFIILFFLVFPSVVLYKFIYIDTYKVHATMTRTSKIGKKICYANKSY